MFFVFILPPIGFMAWHTIKGYCSLRRERREQRQRDIDLYLDGQESLYDDWLNGRL